MTEPEHETLWRVEQFVKQHQADSRDVHPSGLRTITGADEDEIATVLDELAARRNGSRSA